MLAGSPRCRAVPLGSHRHHLMVMFCEVVYVQEAALQPTAGCQASSQVSAVRDFLFFSFFFCFLHSSTHLFILRQLESLFSEQEKGNFVAIISTMTEF